MSSPAVEPKFTSAPWLRPIQLICWVATRSMKSTSFRSSIRRSAYSVIFSIHWLLTLWTTSLPHRSQTPPTTSSLASTTLQLEHQFTFISFL